MASSAAVGKVVAAAGDAAAELARRRELERERSRRFRERQRGSNGSGGVSPHAGSGAPDPAPPHVHATRPLGDGAGPEEFRRAAPPVEPVAPQVELDPEGARKFAAAIALLFRIALDDAAARYDLSRLAAELGATIGADEWQTVRAGAVGFVFARAERCALRHGIGLSIPWEDELVTLGAGAGSALYLLAKITGRLDRHAGPMSSPSSPPADRAGPPTDDVDELDDAAYGPLRVERAAAGR